MRYYLKKYWVANLLAILPGLVVCALQVGNDLLMMRAFEGIIDRNLSDFIFWMLMMAGAWVLLLWIGSLRDYFQARAIRAMNNAVRRDIAATLLHKSHVEFHGKDTGEYLSWFVSDVNQMEDLAWTPFYQCMDYAATAIFCVVALLTLHWSLLAAALVNAAVMLLAPQLFTKRMEKLGKSCETEQAKATGKLKDILSGFDVLRSFGRETRFRQGADEASEQIEKPRFRLRYVKAFITAGFGCVNLGCQMLINLLIGLLSIRGVILQGALMGGGNLVGGLSNSVGNLAQYLLSFSSTKPYFDKITEHGESIQDEEIGNLPEIGNAITVKDLIFRYDEKPVLNGLSLTFKRGGKYALTGPSGCGKSTLLKLLLGWLPDYNGTIKFDSADARDFTPEQLQQQMSYIEQNVFLFNSTIRDNIIWSGTQVPLLCAEGDSRQAQKNCPRRLG